MESWGAALYGDPCRECGFRWGLTPEQAVAAVAALPARYRELLAGRTGRERHPDLSWTPAAYVCHVADNLRAWAERLAGARLSGDPAVPGYDPDALAAARGYDRIGPAAALWSLEHAVPLWAGSVTEALAAGTLVQHATRGLQTAADVARNNAHDAHHHAWDVTRILAATPI